MNYTQKTVSGLAWTSALRGVIRASTIIKIAVLARLLTPDQFGLFGICTLVLSLLEIVTETGVNVFLIQEKADIGKYLNTAWITSIIRGTVITAVLVALAIPISAFFTSPDTVPLLFLLASVPLIRGFINPGLVSYQKHLQFRREFAFRSTLAVIEAVIAVALAVITRSPSSLIWAMIISALFETLLSHLLISPRPRLLWDRHQFAEVFKRGKWVTAAGLFNYAFHEGDDIVVGRLLGLGSLGLYQTVYKIAILPITEIADVFGRVTFPVYAQIASDTRHLRRAFSKVTLGITALTLPLSAVIFLFPAPIINLVLGSLWLPAAPSLRILAIFGGLRAVSGSSSALFMAVKKQHYVTAVTLVSVLGLGLTIIPLVARFGLVGAAYSALIGSLAALPVIAYCLRQVFNASHAPR